MAISPPEALLLGLYFSILSLLAMYGAHRTFLVYLYMKHRNRAPVRLRTSHPLPPVTVQLPIFNEMYVADRLIDAVCKLDYPRELLEIQVLDDSIDETRQIAEAAVCRHVAEGIDIRYLHRDERRGFKAGALEAGLKIARGQLVAVFDADFVPSPDFLRRTIPVFADPAVGMVQARWGHLNPDYSLLTRIQSILLDGHFVLEHGSRYRAGLFFNFNGTAGVWRRAAIDSAGGWQHDTLTEDLDLSYRAQLVGWKFVFVQELESLGELPVEMNAFKTQQRRWAKGSVQTCRKLLPRILRSTLPLRVKTEAFFHLSANFNYLLMLALSLLLFPAIYIRYRLDSYGLLVVDVPLFCAATLSVANFYGLSQREVYPDWKVRLKYLPAVIAVGLGLSVNNSRAVLEGLWNGEAEFMRTPKYGIERRGDDWSGKKYRQSRALQPLIEVALGVYFTGAVLYAMTAHIYGMIPFLMLFQFGFLYTGLLSVAQQQTSVALVLKTQVASGD